jgi:hypothetical protein
VGTALIWVLGSLAYLLVGVGVMRIADSYLFDDLLSNYDSDDRVFAGAILLVWPVLAGMVAGYAALVLLGRLASAARRRR